MPENSKTSGEKSSASYRSWPAIAAGIAIPCLYLFGLTMPLVGPDEPRYAQVAREMYERGDWITPTLGGFNWFEKPALLYWLEIAAYKVFGVTEFSARLGSALFGLGTVASLWLIAKIASAADHSSQNRRFANWTALIAASTIGIIVFSRGASFDIILTFPITAALGGFFAYDRCQEKRERMLGLFVFYFFIGIAVLAKGLVGIVFPFAIVGLYFAIMLKRPSRQFFFSLPLGVLLILAVTATWYLPMYLRHGYAFIDEFFVQHHFQRFTSNKYSHPQPFYFFFWVLPLMMIPWLPFFAAAIWNWSKDLRMSISAGSPKPDNGLRFFSAAWIAVPLLFFSFSGSKLPGYILPCVPGAILLTAEFVIRWISEIKRRKVIVEAVAAGTFVVVIAAMFVIVPSFANADSVKFLIAAANERGYEQAEVVSLHTISHNAEFYASGRIVRTPDGKQKRLYGPTEVLQEIEARGRKTMLVLVPLEYVDQLRTADYLNAEIIADNGELAIAAVRSK